MRKKLMAAAVAGVFAAPALVLAQSSTVQIYGRITYEYGYADQGSGRPSADVTQTPGGSAIGFKGEEKLGGGLTAWFQCESSADVRGLSQDGLCTRNSAVGFKGGWGNLHFGRWDSPFKRAINMGTVGVYDTGLLGHSFVFVGGSTGTNATTASNRDRWKRRDVGWTYYESPIFSGFQILAGFTPGNGATNAVDGTSNQKPRVLSLGGTYKQGPIAVGLAYEKHDDFGAPAVGGPDLNDDAWTISAAYTFMNKVKVGVAYFDSEYETSATTKSEKQNWLVGVDWQIAGPHSVHAGYVNADDTEGNGAITIGATIAPAGPSTGADWYSIAYQYQFSKRTRVRIGYVAVDNDANAFYALGGLSRPVSNGEDQDAIAFHIRHDF
jgi:predicted porin